MFRRFLSENDLNAFDYSGKLLPDAEDREYWDPRYFEDFVSMGENYLGFDWPVIPASDFMSYRKTGNREIMELKHFRRREALYSLVAAEVLEHKGRFIPDIVNGLFALCEETYWGVSAHWPDNDRPGLLPSASEPYIDLFCAETAAGIALTYYMLYKQLYDYCPEILERVDYELDRRIVKRYLDHQDWWWMGYGRDVNNWNPWIISNVLNVFLVTVHNRETMIRGLRKMLTELERFYIRLPEDGGCDEGISYWGQAGASLFEFAEQLYRATDGAIRLFEDDRFVEMGRYPYRMHIIGRRFVNYADGGNRLGALITPTMYLFGLRTGDGRMMDLAHIISTDYVPFKKEGRTRADMVNPKLRRMLWYAAYRNEINAPRTLTVPENCVLPVLQISMMRENGWVLGIKGGHNDEGHNHNDVGSFVLFDGSNPVLIDTGAGVYTRETFSANRYSIWFMRSCYHNLPDFDGIDQHNGRSFACDGFSVNGNETTVSFAKAYEQPAKKAVRTVRLTAEGLDVNDQLAGPTEGAPVTEHFMTVYRPKKTEEGIVIGDYVLACNGEFSVDEQSIADDGNFRNSWGTDTLYRLNFRFVGEKEYKINIKIRRKDK